MEKHETRYGDINYSKSIERYSGGEVKSCLPSGESVLETSHGRLVPQHTSDELRKKEIPPVVFHKNGELKSVALQNQVEIKTPAGNIPAELVTFHPNGHVNRVFPLNGKLSGYWSQEDEAELAKPVHISTPLGEIVSRLISVCFYDTGALRSVTLWPGDTVDLATPAGKIETRIGFSFYPDGSLESLEPAGPTLVDTPVGKFMAYDLDAVGVNGDVNSLCLDQSGKIRRLATTMTGVEIVGSDGSKNRIYPDERESLCSESEKEVVPMLVEFSEDSILLRQSPDDPQMVVSLAENEVRAVAHMPQFASGIGLMTCSV